MEKSSLPPPSELPACPSPSFHSPHARLASSSTSSRNAVEGVHGASMYRERGQRPASRTRTHVTSRLCVRVGVLISARVCVCASPGRRSLSVSLSHSLVPHCTVRPPCIVVGYVGTLRPFVDLLYRLLSRIRGFHSVLCGE